MKLLIAGILLVCFTDFDLVCGHSALRGFGQQVHNSHGRRVKRTTLDNRVNCAEGDVEPVNRVDTSARVALLRDEMEDVGLSAYIIPMDDAHQSEYVSDHDMRVLFISGFSGSAGRAVVIRGDTEADNMQALWTDGRYFLQAEDELDCNWILMREGEAGTPEIEEWLSEHLNPGDVVGADDRVLSYDRWQIIADGLTDGITMEPARNLVDEAWTASGVFRPEQTQNEIYVHPEEFAGESWQDKVVRVRNAIEGSAVAAVFSALDESAWLFNLRGSDISYNPVFFSYSIVEQNSVSLFIQDGLLTADLRDHLNTAEDGSCGGATSPCVQVLDYADFSAELTVKANALPAGDRIWVSPMSGYALYSDLGTNDETRDSRAHLEPSVLRIMKARKNAVERGHLRECYKRDSAGLIEFLAELEAGVKNGDYWDELSAEARLEEYRRDLDNFMGLSFGSISGFGSNGAIIHYAATNETNVPITTDDMYLLDSGGQYWDGTTDVTRTFHFGTPKEKHKEVYTRVLMGMIDLAQAVWANGTYGRDFDALARAPLWAAGLDYNHGTGHGIGMFLHVHEGPGRIRLGYRPLDHETPVYGDMLFSDEPGYYKDGSFGVRLETVVLSKVVETEFRFEDNDYLGFEVLTLVPFETNLIDYDLLSVKQIEWLNWYNERCLQEIGEEIILADPDGVNQAAYDWIVARTQPISTEGTGGAAGVIPQNMLWLILSTSLCVIKILPFF